MVEVLVVDIYWTQYLQNRKKHIIVWKCQVIASYTKVEGQRCSIENYAKDLISTAKEIALKIVYMLEIIDQTPVDLNCNLQKAIVTTQKLIGCMKKDSVIYSRQMPTHTSISQEEDALWQNEAVTKWFEDVNSGTTRRDNFLNRIDDMPRFSLGLTQMFDAEKNANMNTYLCVEGAANALF